ncbi:hypothetical protein [Actinocrispum wychmicini]|uniref:LPXTG-motif cell wall-anchored protein n=1 Tax=Actinocrispum wychmicini TaxID=1213861 RepID=A0A4R2JY95_9PSEU|nr:hypothetical protein [Actinocrispum wychmicini]TCO65573.1 hypothetical protein EV192_1011365 [Actinocrispum wychmicini]
MARTVSKALLACVFALLMLVPAQATAAPGRPIGHVQAPPGPDIPKAPTVDDAAQSKDKLVIGVVAVVLLGIVIYGHRLRSKRKKASGGS